MTTAPFYALSATDLRGAATSFDSFAGSVVLVVNTASHCGFTPQYDGLEGLYRAHRGQGFTVLGFPCNQFGHQEPGGVAEIEQVCRVNHGVTFPIFAKVDVNGPAAHPVFQYLTTALPGWFGKRIRWNFTKFLIGRDGRPLRRFAPYTKPAKLEGAIRTALAG